MKYKDILKHFSTQATTHAGKGRALRFEGRALEQLSTALEQATHGAVIEFGDVGLVTFSLALLRWCCDYPDAAISSGIVPNDWECPDENTVFKIEYLRRQLLGDLT